MLHAVFCKHTGGGVLAGPSLTRAEVYMLVLVVERLQCLSRRLGSSVCVQVIELFKAADKYDVLGLVQECVARFRKLTGAAEVAPLLQVSTWYRLPCAELFFEAASICLSGDCWGVLCDMSD